MYLFHVVGSGEDEIFDTVTKSFSYNDCPMAISVSPQL